MSFEDFLREPHTDSYVLVYLYERETPSAPHHFRTSGWGVTHLREPTSASACTSSAARNADGGGYWPWGNTSKSANLPRAFVRRATTAIRDDARGEEEFGRRSLERASFPMRPQEPAFVGRWCRRDGARRRRMGGEERTRRVRGDPCEPHVAARTRGRRLLGELAIHLLSP